MKNDQTDEAWARFVVETRELSGDSQGSFAAKIGVTQQTVSLWEGGQPPRKSARIAVVNFRNSLRLTSSIGAVAEQHISSRDEATNVSAAPVPDGYDFDSVLNTLDDVKIQEFTLVPKYRARLSGGAGSFETSDQIEANLSFRTTFLYSRGNPNKMALFEVMGDSMEPFLYDGDVVLVDQRQIDPEHIVDGKAYAFREDHTIKVKRLSVQGRALLASSENSQKYPPYEVEVDRFQLIGRVIWVGHEVW